MDTLWGRDTFCPHIRESRGLGYARRTSGRYGTHHLYGDRVRQTSIIYRYIVLRGLGYPPLFSPCPDL